MEAFTFFFVWFGMVLFLSLNMPVLGDEYLQSGVIIALGALAGFIVTLPFLIAKKDEERADNTTRRRR